MLCLIARVDFAVVTVAIISQNVNLKTRSFAGSPWAVFGCKVMAVEGKEVRV